MLFSMNPPAGAFPHIFAPDFVGVDSEKFLLVFHQKESECLEIGFLSLILDSVCTILRQPIC